MIVGNIETIFVNSSYCVMSNDKTEFFLEIEDSELLKDFSHIAVSSLSISNSILTTEDNVLYLHCSAVNNKLGSKFNTGSSDSDYNDILTAMNVSSTSYTRYNESYELLSNMRRFISTETNIKFHFTNSQNKKIILTEPCDFTLNFITIDTDISTKLKTLMKAIGHMLDN